MTRRTILLTTAGACLALAFLHVARSGRHSLTRRSAATGAMPYEQLKQAIHNGEVMDTPARRGPSPEQHAHALDTLDRAKVLALPPPDRVLATLRRIWSAQEAHLAVSADAKVLSAAAGLLPLTDASRSTHYPDLSNRQGDWRGFIREPEQDIAATKKTLQAIGDAEALKTVQSIVDVPGKTPDARAAARAKRLDRYDLAQWNAVLATLSAAQLEVRMAAFIQAHPDTTILPPSSKPLPDQAWDSSADWKEAQDTYARDVRFKQDRAEEARIDQLPVAELLKKDEHTIYSSAVRRVEKKEEQVGLEGLTPLEGAISLITAMDAEVSNGGFDQFFFNSSGSYWRQTRDALQRVHADKVADVYARALAAFPGGTPSDDRSQRYDQMEQLKKKNESPWGLLDEELYRCDSELEVKLVAAIRAAPDQLQPLAEDAKP